MELNGQFHASAALTPEEEPRYPSDKTIGPQSLGGRCGEEKNLLSLMGIEEVHRYKKRPYTCIIE
jgi:hypothetical protein